MRRKYKVRILASIAFPIAIVLPLLTNILFPNELSFFIKISFLFLPLLILFLLFPLPISQLHIGGEQSTPATSYWKWLFKIIVIELGFTLLFINQCNFFSSSIVQTNQLVKLSDTLTFKTIFSSFLINWGFFPWAMISVIAVFFAYAAYKKNSNTPLSAHILNWPFLFLRKELSAISENYFKYATRIFIALNISFFILQLLALLLSNSIVFSIFDGLMMTIIALQLYKKPSVQHLLEKIEQKQISQGIHFIIILCVLFLIGIIIHPIIRLLLNRMPLLLNKIIFSPAFYKQNIQAYLTLWNWGFWIIAMPLMTSLLVAISHGRTIKTFLMTLLILPVVMLLLFYLLSSNQITLLQSYLPIIKTAILLSSIIFLFTLLLQKKSHKWYFLGYFPPREPKKNYRVTLDQLYLMTIPILFILLAAGLCSIQLFVILLSLPCFIIFLLLPIQDFK